MSTFQQNEDQVANSKTQVMTKEQLKMKVKLDEKAMPQGSQQVSQDLTQSYSALASTERQQLAYIAVDSNR